MQALLAQIEKQQKDDEDEPGEAAVEPATVETPTGGRDGKLGSLGVGGGGKGGGAFSTTSKGEKGPISKGPPVKGKKAPENDTANVPSFTQSVNGNGEITFVFATENEKKYAYYVEELSDKKGSIVPLAPCVYRLLDLTLAPSYKKGAVPARRAVLKLGVLRALRREMELYNAAPAGVEEDEANRFNEILLSCAMRVYQRPVEVRDLDDFLHKVEESCPQIAECRAQLSSLSVARGVGGAAGAAPGYCGVDFYPGLGECFPPGAQVVTAPENLDGALVGARVVQSYYTEEVAKATKKVKRSFILMLEFVASVGDKLAYIGMSDVYTEFDGKMRVQDLRHRRVDLLPDAASILKSLQKRGLFYADIAIKHTFVSYGPGQFFPIPIGYMSSKALRPLQASGRIMVDSRRGCAEGHFPTRGGDGASISGLSIPPHPAFHGGATFMYR